jgi:hypothetical protein
MSKERELLQRLVSAELNDIFDLLVEAQKLLAQPEQEPVNFDLERMKLAVESPVSDVTVEGLIDKVKSNREHIVDVTDKVEPVAWRCNLLGNVITDKPADNNSYTPLYKSPPKQEPLSDEEIILAYRELVKKAIGRFQKTKPAHGIGVDDE